MFQTITEIISMLDAEEFPETFAYLSSLNEDDRLDPYDVASTLIDLDKSDDFPEYLIDFISDLYDESISAGNADAMNDLGAQYYDGHRGFEQSFEKAMHYYHLAAQNGSRQAQENLGYCYYYGRDGKRDYEKAFHYFALGAFDGHLISLYKIGDMYLNGYYVEKNEKEAYCIFSHCMQNMTDEAAVRVAGPIYLRLGQMYLDGLGTDKDLKSAQACYQRAEFFLYDMVKNGDDMYRRSLEAAIEGQEKVRKALIDELPQKSWEF